MRKGYHWRRFSPWDNPDFATWWVYTDRSCDNSELILIGKNKSGEWMVDDSFGDEYVWRPIGASSFKEAKLVAETLWRMRPGNSHEAE